MVAAVIFPAIAQGIGGGLVGTPVGHYSFKSELAGVVSDGDFQELGQSGNDLILASCDSPTRSVVRVPEGEILATWLRPDQPRTGGPSLIDVVFKGKTATIGFHMSC